MKEGFKSNLFIIFSKNFQKKTKNGDGGHKRARMTRQV